MSHAACIMAVLDCCLKAHPGTALRLLCPRLARTRAAAASCAAEGSRPRNAAARASTPSASSLRPDCPTQQGEAARPRKDGLPRRWTSQTHTSFAGAACDERRGKPQSAHAAQMYWVLIR